MANKFRMLPAFVATVSMARSGFAFAPTISSLLTGNRAASTLGLRELPLAARLLRTSPRTPTFTQQQRGLAVTMAARERTFIMIKPDAVQRGLVGDIIKRFEQKGFKLCALKFVQADEKLLKEHYKDLVSKPFFPSLLKYMTSGPVVPMVWEGNGVVAAGRSILGATKPSESAPGTVRGDYAIDVGRNVCHGSDGVDTATREIGLWFPEGLTQWTSHSEPWIYE